MNDIASIQYEKVEKIDSKIPDEATAYMEKNIRKLLKLPFHIIHL